MNLTQEQEAALYVQYTPLIYKTVHHFCRLRGIRPEYFEDLFQEASVAFIRHLRRITSTEDIVRFRTPVKRAMATFMEQAFPVHIPHNGFYREFRYFSFVSIDENEQCRQLVLSVPDEVSLEERLALYDFFNRLDEIDRKSILLRMRGYTNQAITTELGIKNVWRGAFKGSRGCICNAWALREKNMSIAETIRSFAEKH